MKNNEISLIVTPEEITNAIAELNEGNDKYLFISNNLFNFKNICTCLKVRENSVWSLTRYVSFKFSYNDKNLNNMITIKIPLVDNSCLSFLKESKFVNDEQINDIMRKVEKNCSQTKINTYNTFNYNDEIVYNEALLIIGKAINESEFEYVKNDFESKFNMWKERQTAINTDRHNLINDLYNKIIKIKLKEKL